MVLLCWTGVLQNVPQQLSQSLNEDAPINVKRYFHSLHTHNSCNAAKVASFRNTAHLPGRQETPESFEATFIQRIGTTAED